MDELDGEFVAEFGGWDRQSWYDLLAEFDDANLYQTWSYERTRRYKGQSVVRMVVRRRGSVVAAAQTRVVRVPGTRAGIAYSRWGPMWRRRGVTEDPEVFRQAVRALRREFSQRRGLVMRLLPVAYQGSDEALGDILREEGYGRREAEKADRTLVIDLNASLEELRASLDQKWRNCLNRAEKSGHELILGEEESLFDEIGKIHGEMVERKGLSRTSDIRHLKRVQRDLPEALRLKVVLSRLGGELCAGAIFAAIGATGLYVRGATSNAGLKTNGSYAVQWAFVRWLRDNGFRYYDLNGISPDVNPGTYHFKRGLAGKRGRDVEFFGRFEASDSAVSEWVVREGEWLLGGCQRIARAAMALRAPHGSG